MMRQACERGCNCVRNHNAPTRCAPPPDQGGQHVGGTLEHIHPEQLLGQHTWGRTSSKEGGG